MSELAKKENQIQLPYTIAYSDEVKTLSINHFNTFTSTKLDITGFPFFQNDTFLAYYKKNSH